MAVLAGTKNTYDMVGIREDLLDDIYNITPEDTPFMSMIGRGRASQRYHEWQTDSLAAPAVNLHTEGADATFATPTSTTRLGNRCQISKKTVLVSGTARSVDTAGREDEFEYQMAKRTAELKKDMELALVTNQGSSAGSSTVVPTSAGAEAIIASVNVSGGTAYSAGGFSSGDWLIPSDGTQRTFTEALLANVAQQVYSAGGKPDYLMVGPFNKRQASLFAGIATQYRENTGRKRATILGSADVYVGEFGEYMIVPNRVQRDRTAFLLQSDMWKTAYLRPFKTEKLAKTGDGDKAQIIVEFTLRANNPASSGKIADLTTS
jgi:hypothetical protein